MYKRSYFSDSEKIDKLLKKKNYKYPKTQGDEVNNQNKTPKKKKNINQIIFRRWECL